MTPALFVRQIVAELRKVIWPTRNELVTYTTVALVFVIIMTAIVTSLDYGFTQLMFVLFG
jgi:preprotein translocase subunit SecE